MIRNTAPANFDFVSYLAHELKTPVSVLKLFMNLHMQRSKGSKMACMGVDELAAIDSELDRLTRLINDLVELSKWQQDKLTIIPKFVNLNELVFNAVKQMQIASRDHQIVFIPKGDFTLFIDSDRIKQVLINLISNSIKYSQKGSQILISVKKNLHSVVISVKDFGKGISEDKQPQIFNQFYRAHNGLKEGQGLGLFICRQILDSHNGKIWVRSKLNKGSQFNFSLPLLFNNQSVTQTTEFNNM